MLVCCRTSVQTLLLALSFVAGAILGWMHCLAVNPFKYSVLVYGPGGAFFALITAMNLLGVGQGKTLRIQSAALRWILRGYLLLISVVFAGGFIEHLGNPPPRWELRTTDELAIAAPADGRFVITCANLSNADSHQWAGPIRLRDCATGHIQASFLPEERIYDLLLSPDGRRLAVMCSNGILKVFKLPMGEVESEMPYFDTENGKRAVITTSRCWAFSQDGQMLAFAARNTTQDSMNQIVLWNANTQKSTVLCEQDVRQVQAFSPNGDFLVLVSWQSHGCLVEFWDTSSIRIDHSFKSEVLISEVVFSPNGTTILAKGGPEAFAEDVWFMDAKTGSKSRELAKLRDFAFAPDGESILAVSSFSSRAVRFDTAAGKQLLEVEVPHSWRPILIPRTPAVVTQENDTIAFWDIPSHRPLWWIVGLIGNPLLMLSMFATWGWKYLRKPD